MYKHFLVSAIRNLSKQKFFSFINVFGLAIGVACCLLIILFVQYELSFDKHFPKSDRIYRMTADIKIGQMEGSFPLMPPPLAQTLVQDYPEIEKAGRLRGRGTFLVRRQETTENIKVENLVYSDQEFIEIFDFQMKGDSLEGALTEPNTMIISASLAEILFPGENAYGQSLIINNDNTYKITGVYENTPKNSHFGYDMHLSLETLDEGRQKFWVSHNFPTYFLLREGADINAFESKLPELIAKYVEPQIKQLLNQDMAEFEANGDRLNYKVQSLSDIYLHSDLEYELRPNGDIRYVWLFTGIAIFIMLIACINFMNLSTAKSANRAKEVGVRKVLGSYRSHLVFQFLIESLILTVAGFLLAILVAWLTVPYFNEISGRNFAIPFSNPLFYGILTLMILLVGMLAGTYPAFFLSGFMPIQVLKGKIRSGASGKWLRSTLVIFQFSTSIVLIAATIAIYQQMSYVQNKKLGFEKDRVIILEDTYSLGESIQAFKKSLYDIPEVKSATVSSFLPVDGYNRSNTMFWPEGDNSVEKQVLMQQWRVDYDYIPTLGMEILAGRAFSEDFSTDSQAIVLNQTAAYRFGFNNVEDAIGERISTFSDINDDTGEAEIGTKTVIGVVEDFHFESLRNSISALCMELERSTGSISVKVETDDLASVLGRIEDKWGQFVQNQPVEYTFLDQQFASMYEAEQKLGTLFGAFAILAILVACLGLFALAAYMAERRTREIGIRKVLGATISDIVTLLSKDFMLLVFIALLIASPISYYLISQWLEDFAYRVNIGISIFILAGILAIIIAFLTISYQSLRAARLQPADILKDE